MVTLGHDGISSTDRLIKYLSLLLSDEKPLTERKRQLEDEYRIPMTYDIEEEMSSMCNMGEAIRRKAEAKGLAEGLAEGRAEGKFETLAELVQRKLLSIKDAAEQAGISEVEFCRKAGLPVQQ